MNKFLTSVMSHDARTMNDAVSHSTSGSSCLDYFFNCGNHRNRQQNLVDADMASIFGENPELGLSIVFYNRMVTRKTKVNNEVLSLQTGQGNRDEFIKSLNWLHVNRPELLYNNLWLVPYVGCWKDLWYYSPVTGTYLDIDQSEVVKLVSYAIQGDQVDLVAKYLPKIRSKKQTTCNRHEYLNSFARSLCHYLGWSERDYRKFKSNPNHTAHVWQRQMSSQDWKSINFDRIPGKALFNLMKSDCLVKHGLESKLVDWLENQDVVKFTGYPYELYQQANKKRSSVQTIVLNKQFDNLVKQVVDADVEGVLSKGVLCAIDTSGSMQSCVGPNTTLTAIDVCVGLGIYFSALNQGEFKDYVVMFDDKSKMKKLNGSFCDRVDQIQRTATAWGSTNFQSVIDEIVRVRNSRPEVPVEDYPEVLLVVSDMQFNPTGDSDTNYEMAMCKLRAVGLSDMTIIWWNVNSYYGVDVPNKLDDKGVVLVSGFDPSVIKMLLGNEKVTSTGEVVKLTPYESMEKALNQDLLNMLSY